MCTHKEKITYEIFWENFIPDFVQNHPDTETDAPSIQRHFNYRHGIETASEHEFYAHWKHMLLGDCSECIQWHTGRVTSEDLSQPIDE